jgi:hypothetical protein
MKRFGEMLKNTWRYFPGMHPGMESLLLQADGRTVRPVQRHLARCAYCRETAQALSAAVQQAHEVGELNRTRSAVLLQDAYENLCTQIQAWRSLSESAPAHRVRGSHRSSRHLLAALEFYFGVETARRMEQATRWNAPDKHLVSSTKPFFTAFLGRKAAEALAEQIAGAA